jgi:AraC family transcriptional regulator of adaptative response/methylated-DNA-[protein]-cysteine methyltransferase
MGEVVSYGEVAHDISQDKAVRAVGSAIGRNPVAVLIPCHRVIQSTGALGGYRWGTERKTVLIGWEGAQKHAL